MDLFREFDKHNRGKASDSVAGNDQKTELIDHIRQGEDTLKVEPVELKEMDTAQLDQYLAELRGKWTAGSGAGVAGKLPEATTAADTTALTDLPDDIQHLLSSVSKKQIGVIKGKVNAGKIDQYFGKNPVMLTDGEANLAIKAIFGEFDWDDVTWIMQRVRNGGLK